jgi:hypothetical protein
MDGVAGRSERDVNTQVVWQRLLAGGHQCCQLLADFSGQFGGKIQPLRKKFGSLVIFLFKGILHL